MLRSSISLTLVLAAAAPTSALAADFTYNPPGVLVPGSGDGRVDEKVYAPGMRFPIEAGPAYANSQVWGYGGGQGPGGSQCDEPNFSYPWSDNYCETRSWDMPLCPSGTGHQGQDIRGADCEKNKHWVVASEAGTVTSVGSYSVYVTAADGTRFDYLHMGNVQVQVGDDVAKGERIGMVSNEFGGTPTTVHLHFNLRQDVAGVGNVYVPPYMSLVQSYQALIGPPVEPPLGSLDEVGCEVGIRGWAISPSSPEVAIEARLYFDGEAGDGATVGHPVLADYARDDLCTSLGSCEHAFEVGLPLSLLDGSSHALRAYASDGTAQRPELVGSPRSFSCAFELPSGVRREVPGLDAKNAWRFSTFWDEIDVSDGVIASLDAAEPLAAAPELLASSADPTVLWLVDRGQRRLVPDVPTARAWELSAELATVVDAAELEALPEGPPLRPRPIVLRAASGELWLVDDAKADGAGGGGAGAGGEGGGDGVADGADPGGCDCQHGSGGSGLGGSLGAAAVGLAIASLRRRARRRR